MHKRQSHPARPSWPAIAILLSTVSLCNLTSAVADPPPATRNWREFPAIVELETDAPIVAIGDVHGDYKRLVNLLTKSGLIAHEESKPVDLKWCGGNAVLVCTGDLIDKGKHSLHVIECFQVLQKQSAAVGGKTLVTMGNHEAEFLSDPEHDEKAEQFLAELEESQLDPVSLASGSDPRGIGKFLRSLPFALRINDWFFAHACSTDGRTLATLNKAIADQVSEDGFGAEILLGKRGLLEAQLEPRPRWSARTTLPLRAKKGFVATRPHSG